MTNNNGPLSLEAVINDEKYQQAFDRMENRFNSYIRQIAKQTNNMDGIYRGIGATIAAAFTFQKADQFVRDIIKVRGEFQQLTIALETMLGSKSKADALISQITKTAATTPFSLQEVAQGAKQLVAYGTAAEDVNNVLTRLGNIASGLSVPLKDLIYLYGTSATQGRLMTQDLNQFAGRGVPIYEQLAKVMGVTKDQIKDLASEGKIGFEQLQKVVTNLTDEGGMFYNLMEKQSKSLSGQISNLGDTWDQMLNKIGESNEGVLSRGIEGAQYLIEHYEAIGKILGVLIATYGTYKAALITVSVAEALVAKGMAIAELTQLVGVVGTATKVSKARAIALGLEATAQEALNIVMRANPYVLVATAMAGIIAASFAFSDSLSTQKRAQEEVNAENEKAAKLTDELKTKTDSLIATIRDESATRFSQVRAFNELKKLYPELVSNMSLEEFQAKKLEEVQKSLNAQRDKDNIEQTAQRYKELSDRVAKLREELEFANKEHEKGASNAGLRSAISQDLEVQETELKKIGIVVKANNIAAEEAAESERVKLLPLQQQIDYYQQIKKELEIQVESLGQSSENTDYISLAVDRLTGKVHDTTSAFGGMQAIINKISLDNLNSRLNSVNKSLEFLGIGVDDPFKNKTYFEGIQKKAKESFESSLPGTEAFKQAKKQYDEATDSLKQWDLTNKKIKIKKEDIALPSGSVAELDRLIQKATDTLSKTPVDQVQRVKDLQDTILKLTEQRVEAQKIIEVRSWQETLDFKKRQYEQYETIVQEADKMASRDYGQLVKGRANNVFKELLDGGKNYLSFLETQLKPVQDKINSGNATDEDLAKFVQLQAQINEFKGTDSPFKQFTDDLDKLKLSSAGAADYLDILKTKADQISNIPIGDRINSQQRQLLELNERIKATTQEQAAALKQFLQQLAGSKQQIDAIIAKYEDLKVAADPTQIESLEVLKQDELNQIALKNTHAFRDMNRVIVGDGVKAIKQYQQNLEELAKVQEDDLDKAIIKLEYLNSLYGEGSDAVKIQADIVKAKTNELDATRNEQIRTSDQLTQQIEQNWLNVANSIGQVGGELQGMEGVLGSIGSLFSGLAGSANTFSNNIRLASYNVKAVKSGGSADTGSSIAAGISGVTNLVGLVVGAIGKRKAARKQRELEAIAFQVQLNKALNDEIRLRTILSENVYFKDYAGRITDAMAAATDAVDKYNKALINLSDSGKTLTGTKNTIDWGNVATGVTTGAGAGLAIGSIVGPAGSAVGAVVGGVVGAVVGGIVGLVSYATKSLYGPLFETYPELIKANGELNTSLAQTLIDTNQVDDKTKLWLADLIAASDAMEEARKQITDIVSELTGGLGNDLRDSLVTAFEDGTDAAFEFSKNVQKYLENALSNLIYSAVFSKAFTKLQQDLEGSLLGNGKSFQQVFAEFLGQSKDLTQAFNDAMKAAQEEGKKFGFDLFGQTDTSNNSAAQGISRSITEATADVITGQLNALRISHAAGVNVLRQHTAQYNQMLHYQSYLVRIDQKLAQQLQTPWRALGLGEDPER